MYFLRLQILKDLKRLKIENIAKRTLKSDVKLHFDLHQLGLNSLADKIQLKVKPQLKLKPSLTILVQMALKVCSTLLIFSLTVKYDMS